LLADLRVTFRLAVGSLLHDRNTREKMAALYTSFVGVCLIALIARECTCEWQRYFDDGKR